MLQNTEIGSSRQVSLRQETFIRCFGKSCSSKPHQREKKTLKIQIYYTKILLLQLNSTVHAIFVSVLPPHLFFFSHQNQTICQVTCSTLSIAKNIHLTYNERFDMSLKLDHHKVNVFLKNTQISE